MEQPERNQTDLVVTIVLLVLLALGTLLVSFFGLFLGMASDNCGDSDCTDAVGIGVVVAAGTPWLVLVGIAAWAILRLARRKIAFWVPLLGAVLSVGAWFLGAAVALSGT